MRDIPKSYFGPLTPSTDNSNNKTPKIVAFCTATILGALTMNGCNDNNQDTNSINNSISNDTEVIDTGKGSSVEIKKNGLYFRVEAKTDPNKDENALGTAHNLAWKYFNNGLENYFKDPNKFYRIKPNSLKISDLEGTNYTIGYEIELQEVSAQDNYIKYSETVDGVMASSYGYDSARKSLDRLLADRIPHKKQRFQQVFVEKKSGDDDQYMLCENNGKSIEIHEVPLKHEGSDSGNSIAFDGIGLFGVCTEKKI